MSDRLGSDGTMILDEHSDLGHIAMMLVSTPRLTTGISDSQSEEEPIIIPATQETDTTTSLS